MQAQYTAINAMIEATRTRLQSAKNAQDWTSVAVLHDSLSSLYKQRTAIK